MLESVGIGTVGSGPGSTTREVEAIIDAGKLEFLSFK
jgi:hypothetical protein